MIKNKISDLRLLAKDLLLKDTQHTFKRALKAGSIEWE